MHAARAEAILAAIGAERDGIVDVGTARERGLSRHVLAHHQRDGRLVRIGRGVWRLRDHPFDYRSTCRAALALAGPSSVLGLRSAARLHGCWAYRHTDAVEVVRVRGCDHRTSVGRLVETRWLPPQHVTMVDGMPATTLARTFFDLCGDPDDGLRLRHPVHERRMKQLYNDCLGRRGLTFTMAVAVLSVMARRGRPGTRLVRKLLRHYGPGHEPTKSDVETLLLELVRGRGLPEPARQAVIVGPRGFIGTVDFAWRAARLVVEVDSAWHDGPDDRERDARRDADLERAGYAVRRYRYGDIVGEPDRVIRELAANMPAIAGTTAAGTED